MQSIFGCILLYLPCENYNTVRIGKMTVQLGTILWGNGGTSCQLTNNEVQMISYWNYAFNFSFLYWIKEEEEEKEDRK